jgi:hypothetical protein
VNGYEQVANGTVATNLFQSAGGGALTSPAAGIAPSIFRSDSHLATSYSQQASLGAEYLIAHDLTASANYLFVRGVKLSRTRNSNLLPPTVLTLQNAASLGAPNPTAQQTGREVFGAGRSNPGFNDVHLLENSASSTYNGLTLSLTRRMNKRLALISSVSVIGQQEVLGALAEAKVVDLPSLVRNIMVLITIYFNFHCVAVIQVEGISQITVAHDLHPRQRVQPSRRLRLRHGFVQVWAHDAAADTADAASLQLELLQVFRRQNRRIGWHEIGFRDANI